jgi:isoleucyl-tRNA synthetase
MVRLLAPVLVFTAEEIFQLMPKTRAMQEIESVHLLKWLDVPQEWVNPKIEERYQLLITLRPFVMRSLEDQRSAGKIGSSLEAKVIFKSCSERDLNYLNEHLQELPSDFIVSQVEIQKVDDVKNPIGSVFAQTEVEIVDADGKKCERCWNYRDLGVDADYPNLCERCAKVVKPLE